MAHRLETFTDGTASFASAREDAWHRLGTITAGAMTAQEALRLARLADWDVRKAPLTTTVTDDDGVHQLPVDERFATVRTHPEHGRPDVLGVVGPDYTPVQNEEHCDLLNTLVDESGAVFETAGSLHGGRQVFVTMKLPRSLRVGGSDEIDLYIAGFNSHDGSSAFRLVVTPVRVVCANTQAAALREARSTFSIRHTSGARAQIAAARTALGLTWEYCDAFEAEAQRMIAAECDRFTFAELVRELFPVPDGATERQERHREREAVTLKRLRENGTPVGGGTTMTGIEGTRWGAYQAVTEYVDHFMPVRGEVKYGSGFADDVRARRTITDARAAALKTAAFDALRV